VLGSPSVANATGSKFIYDDFGTSEFWNWLKCLFGFLAFWFLGFLGFPGCGEGLCYGVIIPFSSFV